MSISTQMAVLPSRESPHRSANLFTRNRPKCSSLFASSMLPGSNRETLATVGHHDANGCLVLLKVEPDASIGLG